MKILACTALLAALALTATGCPGEDNPLSGACGSGFNVDTGAVGDFGADQAALKVEAFLEASGALYGAAVELEADVLAACVAIGGDLDIPAGELEPSGSELEVTAACGRVADEIDEIIATLPSGASLGISVTPASCTVNLDLAASCAAECDVTIEGEATVECDGELHGSCSASCTGECAIEGNVTCTAECSGTCTGTCSGTCNGTCSGTCSVPLDGNGNCSGTCSGTCTGTCDASCSGMCNGTCTSDVTATCSGECYGECSATWEAECNGEANVTADADCKAACDCQANATATCTEPDVTIVVVVPAAPADAARVVELVATLEANYPALLAAQARMEFSLAPSLDAFVDSVEGAATSLASVGAQAAACLGIAVDAVVDAAARIDASVSVSVEISASVSASGAT